MNTPYWFKIDSRNKRKKQIVAALKRIPMFATRAAVAEHLLQEFPQLRFSAEERWGYMTFRFNGSEGVTFDTEEEARAHKDTLGRPLGRRFELRGERTTEWEVFD